MTGSTYERPGTRHYIASSAISRLHGSACVEADGHVGIAQKQKQPASSAGLDNNAQITIASGEAFVMIVKGIVQVPMVTSAVKGSTIWISDVDQSLSLTDPGSGHGHKFGRVDEIQGQRGTPTGYMRVDLDRKDSF